LLYLKNNPDPMDLPACVKEEMGDATALIDTLRRIAYFQIAEKGLFISEGY
jgi:hypothetical protein